MASWAGSILRYLPWVVLIANMILCWSFLRVENGLVSLASRYKAIHILVLVVMFVAVNAALYLSWNAVGADFISGLQGRYFLPLLVALIPIVAMRKRLVLASARFEGVYFVAAELLVLSATASALLHRYFLA